MKTVEYREFVSLIRETILESRRTQDKRLRSFTNSITRSIMALYSGNSPDLHYSELDIDDLNVDPNTNADIFYEIEAGAFPIALDPNSVDYEVYEDGVDPFVTVAVEIDKSAAGFNVSASDKSITGTSDLGIHIAIETPDNFSKKEMGNLRNEIANAVRHELEHVTQGKMSDQPASAYARGDKYFSFIHDASSVDSDQAKYLLEPSEIPAHIRGYMQNAKNIQKFQYDVEDLLGAYVDQKLIKPEEKKIVLDTWIDWVKRNIKRKGY